MFVFKLFDSDVDCWYWWLYGPFPNLNPNPNPSSNCGVSSQFLVSSYPLLVTVTSFQLLTYCRLPIRLPILVTDLLVRERSDLSDPYCQSTWMSVCLCVCVCVCPQLWGQISQKPKELDGKLLRGAYRKVVRGFRMVTSPMTSRDPMTS